MPALLTRTSTRPKVPERRGIESGDVGLRRDVDPLRDDAGAPRLGLGGRAVERREIGQCQVVAGLGEPAGDTRPRPRAAPVTTATLRGIGLPGDEARVGDVPVERAGCDAHVSKRIEIVHREGDRGVVAVEDRRAAARAQHPERLREDLLGRR